MASEPMSATESDASRIADIHMAAFGSNPLFLAQFPTLTVRDQLRSRIAQKAVDDIRDPHIAVLVVRDDQSGVLISFAKWSLPVEASAGYVEAPWVWPEGTDLAVLEQWTQMVEEAEMRALGDLPFYHLTFVGTDPQYERRGAATSLIRWGLDRCAREGVLAYLESTPNAASMYERLGFWCVEKLSIVLNGSITYEEMCYVGGRLFIPSDTASLRVCGGKSAADNTRNRTLDAQEEIGEKGDMLGSDLVAGERG